MRVVPPLDLAEVGQYHVHQSRLSHDFLFLPCFDVVGRRRPPVGREVGNQAYVQFCSGLLRNTL